MSLADQHDLYEQLGQRLHADRGDRSDEHRRLLDERVAGFDADGDPGEPWEKVEARIRANLGRW